MPEKKEAAGKGRTGSASKVEKDAPPAKKTAAAEVKPAADKAKSTDQGKKAAGVTASDKKAGSDNDTKKKPGKK